MKSGPLSRASVPRERKGRGSVDLPTAGRRDLDNESNFSKGSKCSGGQSPPASSLAVSISGSRGSTPATRGVSSILGSRGSTPAKVTDGKFHFNLLSEIASW